MQTAQVLQHYSLSSSSHLRSILLDRSIDAKNYELHCLERHVDLEIAPEMMNQGGGGGVGLWISVSVRSLSLSVWGRQWLDATHI
jgi:hypothetical protein